MGTEGVATLVGAVAAGPVPLEESPPQTCSGIREAGGNLGTAEADDADSVWRVTDELRALRWLEVENVVLRGSQRSVAIDVPASATRSNS